MKRIIFRIAGVALLFLVAVLAAMAQETIELPAPANETWQLADFLDLFAALEAALIVVLGYLHNFIPGLNRIPSKWFRVVIIGAVVIVIFTALGWQTGFGQVLVFLQAVGFYEINSVFRFPQGPDSNVVVHFESTGSTQGNAKITVTYAYWLTGGESVL